MFLNYTTLKKNISVLLVMLLLSPFVGKAQIITTFAGTGSVGYSGDGGFARYASLNTPQGLALDTLGNLYISDQKNSKIRKVDIYGVITTIAGAGLAGSSGDGGPAEKAKINYPAGMAIDKIGNLYFADSRNHKIRKIDTGGTITTVAGNGTAGFSGDDSLAIYAQLNEPTDVALDDTGNMYIADHLNSRVRKVDVNGNISTLAGTGDQSFFGDGMPATVARLNRPLAVAVGKAGEIYVADSKNDRIRKIGTDGIITTVAGDGTAGFGGDGGIAGVSKIYYPTSLAVDKDGNVYFADRNNNRVRKLGTDGVVNTIAGAGQAISGNDGGIATDAYVLPTCVALDRAGNMYIGESVHKIRYVYLNEVELDETVDVFPNPCFKYTSLFMPSKYEEIAYIYVLDELGRMVYETTAPTNKVVSVKFGASGSYVIYAVSKHGKWIGKALSVQ